MPQTRSRSASQRCNITNNTGNTINEMVNTITNNQVDNTTMNSTGSSVIILNTNASTSTGPNSTGLIDNRSTGNGSSDVLEIEISQENRTTTVRSTFKYTKVIMINYQLKTGLKDLN